MIQRLFTKGIFRSAVSFIASGAWPRAGDILLTQETLISILMGVFAGVAGAKYFPDSGKLTDVCLGFIAYGAIALGFCVAGVTIAMTLPDRKFMQSLSTLCLPKRHGNALSNLLFVFCWTALVHWIGVVFCLLTLLSFGHKEESVLSQSSVTARIILGAGVFIGCYALAQFLITVMTLWQVGLRYINELQKDESAK